MKSLACSYSKYGTRYLVMAVRSTHACMSAIAKNLAFIAGFGLALLPQAAFRAPWENRMMRHAPAATGDSRG